MYAPWFVGAILLAASAMTCCVFVRRRMGISGHITAWVDRLRERLAPPPDEDLVAALREATAEQFGEAALQAPPPAPEGRLGVDFVVPAGILVGGLLSAALGGFPRVSALIATSVLPLHGPGLALALVAGGFLVGFGARLAGGCTMGHGLMGVSQLQPGSLAATAGFFASGVALSFLIGALA